MPLHYVQPRHSAWVEALSWTPAARQEGGPELLEEEAAFNIPVSNYQLNHG